MSSLRFRSSWSVCALLALACSAGSESNSSDDRAGVGQLSEPVVIVNNADCMVEVTKIDYNQPGSDANDFIELKVTKKNPGVVTTLLNCGIGAIAAYDESSLNVAGLCPVPYSLTILASLAIPADGYIEIGQNSNSTVAATIAVGSGADGWLHNGRGEIAFLQTAVASGLPVSWFQYGGTAKCNGVAVAIQVQTEDDSSPNYTNVSCSGTNTFHTVLATNAVPKTIADCPASGGAGGAGGGGGTAGLGGTGGLLNVGGLINFGGTGGLLNLGGLLNVGGLLNLGGTGGLPNLGGAGGLPNLGGTGGLPNLGGTGGLPNLGGTGGLPNLGGTGGLPNLGGAGHGGSAGALSAAGHAGANTAGEPGEDAGGAANPGDAGSGNDTAGALNGHGGASAAGAGHGAAAGKAETGEAGSNVQVKGDVLISEGGGCSCSIPSAPNHQRTQALALLAALIGLCIHRRKTRPS